MARALHLAAAANRETVKPEPAADMWEKMEVVLKEMSEYIPPRPANSFTRDEFAEKFHFSDTQANRRLKRLAVAGKITRHGHSGRHVYYVFTDVDGQRQPGPKSPR